MTKSIKAHELTRILKKDEKELVEYFREIGAEHKEIDTKGVKGQKEVIVSMKLKDQLKEKQDDKKEEDE